MDKKAYKFGVEIECTMPYYNEEKFAPELEALGCHIKDDGSISAREEGHEGYEIVTPPLGYNAMWRRISKISKVLSKYGVCADNQSCGLHIHISHRKFKLTKYLKRIILVWLAIEDVMFATQPRSRLTNGYCKRLLRTYVRGTFDDMPANKDRLISKIGERYFALNLQNLYGTGGLGTVEIRLHAFTTSHIKIRNWMTLMRAVLAYALDRYDRQEVKELYQMTISEEKINKTWELLKLDSGVREFYNNRINQMLFERLALQQGKALEYDKIKNVKKKILRRYQKAEQELNNVQNTESSIASAFSS